MTSQTHPIPKLYALNLPKSILWTLPMALFSAMLISGGGALPGDPRALVAMTATWILMNTFFFLMIYTGKTHRYRATLFTLFAVCFVINFIPSLIETRGNIAFTQENIIQSEIPFCHMVIPMILAPWLINGTIIFPGSLVQGATSIGSMIVLWLGASLALGRGFCSWGCFFGGLDEGCARIAKKPLLKNFDPRLRYLPYAVLVGIVLTSAVALEPTYCTWLCPYKAVTEFEAVTSFKVLVQTIIFGSLFVGLVIVLPILMKRRVQCGLFCPFGAMQSLTNKINIFDIRIEPDKCAQCGRCIRECPTFSLDESSLSSGKTLLSCTKCGKCVDTCPKHAISFHVKGTQIGTRIIAARMLYLFPAFLFMATFGGWNITGAIYRILKLITTGSLI